MILLISNYSSLIFNIYRTLNKFNYSILIMQDPNPLEIKNKNISHIIIAFSEKKPSNNLIEIIKEFSPSIPILGISLGFGAILNAFESTCTGNIICKKKSIQHNGCGIFRHVNQNFNAMIYSQIEASLIPPCFEITAWNGDEVMAIEHKYYQVIGLQFNPESNASENGEKIFLNFLHYQRQNIPIQEYLKEVLNGGNLTFKQSYDVMDEITYGNMHDAQIGSFLTSLEIKGVKPSELAGFASALKNKAIPFDANYTSSKRMDIVGTGGSNRKTFNVSTTVAFLLNAAGANIIKHGNGAITSKSGGADLLTHLGININMDISTCINIYHELGITFIYAPKFHAALAFASSARKALGFKTAFNLIGPLSNPAKITHQLIGVFNKNYTEIIANTLKILGINRAMVVSGFDGYDEISLSAPTQITELINGEIKTYIFTPLEVGLDYVPHSTLVGGNAIDNAKITMDIFNGLPSNKANLVCINAAAAMYLYGLSESIKEGFFLIKKVIEGKKVFEILDRFKHLSNS